MNFINLLLYSTLMVVFNDNNIPQSELIKLEYLFT